ncbi:MAG TPA: YtcA family lipoprotein [Candidatus Binataceae bacterium]|nr:YtcA family lipoprotein [Candidatus Binataceae bacterium]
MIANAGRLSRFTLLLLAVMLSSSCSRAPSFDILGSFFPAWLLCVALSLIITVAARWLLLRAHVLLALPILTYPSLTALFTFALWLAFFR